MAVYAIEAIGLRHLKSVPAGEAVDVPATVGQRLAATFARAALRQPRRRRHGRRGVAASTGTDPTAGP
ncbi:MAG: hypothetical protein U0736_09380 [Gemmataceae bacterium]